MPEQPLALILDVHPQNPQARLLRQAVEQARSGALLVYPTDTCYALGCRVTAKAAQERLRQIRQLDMHHDLSLLFSSISQLTEYAKLDDRSFAILKRVLPGPFTFILPATHDVPRRLADPRRRSIGVRVPDAPIVQTLLTDLGEPLMSSTLQLPHDAYPLHDATEIDKRVGSRVDVILRAGDGSTQCSTVIDLCDWPPRLLRRGLGDPDSLGIELTNDGNPPEEGV
ncbi:L-threonylcarbamoyladenylate synthase [Acidithiobacillus sp. IBUN Pt1247-S3]|uniref:L-threonylcarbamoyladenylate synthase n=1 Tax=Acidithiobacillus sp. IBUN Pt1247-S3 TaxID=3166642 RepID=UPI0034E5CAC7